MKHRASRRFWECYEKLPAPVRALADRNFQLLKSAPTHSSLHFKTVGRYRSVRIGPRYRALGIEVTDGIPWFWIGNHDEYERIVG